MSSKLDELKAFFLVVGVSYRRYIAEIDDMTEATAEVIALIAEAERLQALFQAQAAAAGELQLQAELDELRSDRRDP